MGSLKKGMALVLIILVALLSLCIMFEAVNAQSIPNLGIVTPEDHDFTCNLIVSSPMGNVSYTSSMPLNLTINCC